MEKLNRTIKGLKCCIIRDPDDKLKCKECPYEPSCVSRLIELATKANILLTKPHLLSLDYGLYNLETYDVVWLETYWDGHTHLESLVLTSNEYQEPSLCNGITTLNLHHLHQSLIDSFSIDYADTRYRFWSSKPSKEDRENETRWNTCNTKY